MCDCNSLIKMRSKYSFRIHLNFNKGKNVHFEVDDKFKKGTAFRPLFIVVTDSQQVSRFLFLFSCGYWCSSTDRDVRVVYNYGNKIKITFDVELCSLFEKDTLVLRVPEICVIVINCNPRMLQ